MTLTKTVSPWCGTVLDCQYLDVPEGDTKVLGVGYLSVAVRRETWPAVLSAPSTRAKLQGCTVTEAHLFVGHR